MLSELVLNGKDARKAPCDYLDSSLLQFHRFRRQWGVCFGESVCTWFWEVRGEHVLKHTPEKRKLRVCFFKHKVQPWCMTQAWCQHNGQSMSTPRPSTQLPHRRRSIKLQMWWFILQVGQIQQSYAAWSALSGFSVVTELGTLRPGKTSEPRSAGYWFAGSSLFCHDHSIEWRGRAGGCLDNSLSILECCSHSA